MSLNIKIQYSKIKANIFLPATTYNVWKCHDFS